MSDAAVAAVEQQLDIGGTHGGWQRGQAPSTDRRHRRPELQPGETLQVQEPQDRAQLGHPPLGRPGRNPTALADQERVDVLPGQRRRIEDLPVGCLLGQEAACGVLIAQHRGRSQIAFLDHPGSVPREQHLPRCHRQRCLNNEAGIAQIAQQRPHRPRPRDPVVTRRPSGGPELRHPLLVEFGCLQFLGRQPPAHLAQVREHVQDRPRRVALLRQPGPVALDVRAQPTSLPSCSCHRARLPRGSTVLPRSRLLSAGNYAEANEGANRL